MSLVLIQIKSKPFLLVFEEEVIINAVIDEKTDRLETNIFCSQVERMQKHAINAF